MRAGLIGHKAASRWTHIDCIIGSYATTQATQSHCKRWRGRTFAELVLQKYFSSLSLSLFHSPSLTPVVTQMQVLPVLWLIALLTDIARSNDSIASKQLVLDPTRLCKRSRRLKGKLTKSPLKTKRNTHTLCLSSTFSLSLSLSHVHISFTFSD